MTPEAKMQPELDSECALEQGVSSGPDAISGSASRVRPCPSSGRRSLSLSISVSLCVCCIASRGSASRQYWNRDTLRKTNGGRFAVLVCLSLAFRCCSPGVCPGVAKDPIRTRKLAGNPLSMCRARRQCLQCTQQTSTR